MVGAVDEHPSCELTVKKTYAVGLEMSCPGGAYQWAPEIPTYVKLASAQPSKCELAHNWTHSSSCRDLPVAVTVLWLVAITLGWMMLFWINPRTAIGATRAIAAPGDA